MGYPAIQLITDTGSTPTNLTIIHVGSDDLSEALRRDRAGITHSRYGVPVASRTWKQAKVWNLNINSASQSYMETLRTFFEAGSFYLYPDSENLTIKYTVYWMEDSFDPQYIAPNQYSLRATFKETTIGAGTPLYLEPTGDQTVNGNLYVDGTITCTETITAQDFLYGRFKSDIYLNYDGPEGSSNIYFYNGGVSTGSTFKWDESNSRFALSDSLYVSGSLLYVGSSPSSLAGISFAGGSGLFAYNPTNSRFEVYQEIATIEDLKASKDVYIGFNGAVGGRSRIYFHDGNSASQEFISFSTGTGVFQISAPINVVGEISGTNLYYNTQDTDSRYRKIINSIPSSAITAGTFDSGGTGTFTFRGPVAVSGATIAVNSQKFTTGGITFSGGVASILHSSAGFAFSDTTGQDVTFNQGINSIGPILSAGTDLSTIINSAAGGDHTHSITALTADLTSTSHVLDSGDDVDEYHADGSGGTGFFAWNASAPANAPEAKVYKCMLSMDDGAQTQQLVWGGASADEGIYIRRRDSGVWNSWKKFAQETWVNSKVRAKSITILEPQAGDEATMWSTEQTITGISTNVILRGDSPSVTWELRQGTDRSAAGTLINSGTSTSTTTLDADTSLIAGTIASGRMVWLEVIATGGTSVDEFHMTFKYSG